MRVICQLNLSYPPALFPLPGANSYVVTNGLRVKILKFQRLDSTEADASVLCQGRAG